MKNNLILISIFFINHLLLGQDIHWSQPTNALLFQSPALTGVSGKYDLVANYKNQWNAVNTNYNTFMLSGDYRLGKGETQNNQFGIGVILLNDKTGEGNFKTTSGGLTFAYLLKASRNLKVGGGLGINLVQNTLQNSNFTWGDQFNGNKYDPSLSSNESNFGLTNSYVDINSGISLLYGKGEESANKTKWIFAYSVNHINKPNISLTGIGDLLHIKQVFHFSGFCNFKDNLSLKPVLSIYSQGTLSEFVGGSLLRYSFGQQSKITGIKKGSGFAFGALFRWKDAVIPTVEFDKGNLLFGVSYDVNVSSLSPSSKLRGGIQFSLRFTDLSNYLYKGKPQI